jgi:plasmid rolling circle replication initiator protein Rep
MKNIRENGPECNIQADNSGNNTLEKQSPRDAKWTVKKRGAVVVQDHYEQQEGFKRLSNRMNECASFLDYTQTLNTQTGELALKLVNAKFCHVRHCEICMWRRSMRNVAKFMQRLPPVFEQYAQPMHEWLFLTLTVPNCKAEDLRSTIDRMQESFKRLVRREEFKTAFIGYVKTVEVTKEDARNGYVHPHFHVLLLTSKWYFKSTGYIKQPRMLELWQEAMRDDSITQVDMRKVKKNKGGTLFSAVIETLKYGVKPADIKGDKDFLYAITEQLHKLRFVDTGGVLKGILKDEKSLSNHDLVDTKHPEEVHESEIKNGKGIVTFRWQPARRRYIKKGTS